MSFLEAIWKYLLISSPYLMIGFFIAGVVHHFISVEKMKSWLGKNKISDVFKAALLGVPLPLCSCAVIPSAVTLRKAGASNGSTSAFLIATPESGVDSIAMTYAVLDIPMCFIRPISAFLSAFMAGIFNILFNDFEYKAEQEESKSCCSKKSENDSSLMNKIKGSFQFGFGKLLNDISLWLGIGILVGSLIDYFVPADFFMQFGPTLGRVAILAIGIPVYICASATTPIAAALIMKGLSPGVALILLLVGPATNASNIIVMSKYIGKKGILINVLSIATISMLLSYIVDWMYLSFDWSLIMKLGQFHEHGHEAFPLWQQICAGLMSVLIMKGIWVEEISTRLSKKGHKH